MRMRSLCVFPILLPILLFAATPDSLETRIDALVHALTLEEKIDLLGGTGFATQAVPRLGIPALNMTDGPLGVRWDSATAFPAGIALAASWDPHWAEAVGGAIARETLARGRHVILAPCVNIARIPNGGRNFESFGEDPHLAARMGVAYINGVQANGAAATVKHFAVNNQEHQRMTVDVRVDERTLREIYFPAFRSAVQEANVLCVMSAYNRVNGPYASENEWLLTDVLKREWGFDGLVMSDWGAVHSSHPTFRAGLDLEMPTGKYLNADSLRVSLVSGHLDKSLLDDKVRRILRVIGRLGLLDGPIAADSTVINSPAHRRIAREAARSGIVLLKNADGLLPLDPATDATIAVIGPNAATARTGGGGSSRVTPVDPVDPLGALTARLPNATIRYARGMRLRGETRPIPGEFLFQDTEMKRPGLRGDYFTGTDLAGTAVLTRTDSAVAFDWGSGSPADALPKDGFSVRWSGYLTAPATGIYTISVSADDGMRLVVDGQRVIDHWNDHALESRSARVTLTAGKAVPIALEYYENGGSAAVFLGWTPPGEDLMAQAVDAARGADLVLFFGGTSDQYESEGFDRENLDLPAGQDTLLSALAAVNDRIAVIIQSGSPVRMGPWLTEVESVLMAWFGGSEAGNAVADVLLGDHNPSGRLPVSIPRRWEDGSAAETYRAEDEVSRYSDGIFVGYRHFQTAGIKPLFPFGFGLSYTTFDIGAPEVSARRLAAGDTLRVTVPVTNTGSRAGRAVVQLYLGFPEASVPRPPMALAGFAAVPLAPGARGMARFTLTETDLAWFDAASGTWRTDEGPFVIQTGSAAARDHVATTTVSFEP